MQLFYAPDIAGEYFTLEEQESKHIIRVLRLKAGDIIHITDGKGNLHTAALNSEDPRRCEVRITETIKEFGKRNYHLHLAVAPTKNINRYEWLLEKATEIGVDVLTPLICQRSERRIIKVDRLNKVITAAMKQSVKAYHPSLHEARTFSKFIAQEFEGDKFIAYVEEGDHPALQSLYATGRDALILIGPEGDFSPEEVQMAIDNGFRTISLGKSRLRTETAGVVAVHTVAMVNME
ncbi:MAG: 16S rRNA (uracil(1498)-N(3))-methyltransferase [Bacteroidota bacterium]